MGQFLETVASNYALFRARVFAGGYEGVTHAGIAIVALDTGAVLLAQRAYDETDDPEVAETWEFPGGGLDEGEEPFPGAVRELLEETYLPLPATGMVTGGWRSDDGVYQGFVYTIDAEFPLIDWQPTSECQAVGWFTREMIAENENLRPEVRDQTDWAMIFDKVSGNEEQDMETDSDLFALTGPIPVHGVLAPEEAESGDARGFNAGSMTSRPLRLPFSWQKTNLEGHGGSVVVGSVDRLMRKDGMIHWEGLLMESAEAEEFAGVLAFFERYGVSVDGDRGSMDREKTEASGVLWFDAVRASGLTAVHIPAFSEAYVAFGPHPDMPAPGDDAALVASGLGEFDLVGGQQTFDRGPGWITNPKDTKRIHDYWTKKGEEGYNKIAWGTNGDYRRCVALVGEKIAENSPTKTRFLNQICAQWHHDALGYWPGDLGKPGNAPDTPENRKRAAQHAALEAGRDDIEAAPESEGSAWEAVLVSSATGKRALPPLSYFHEYTGDDGSTVIHEADEFGLRRVTGFAAEWGVCHIGMNGACVEPPRTGNDDYPAFHLGRTKTTEGYVYTGVLTYGVEHRDADTILSESVEKCYFENIKNAWAAVRVGENDRGIWFSGVVLPTVPEADLVAIEASGQVSGEWLYDEMRACLTVNVRGFPVARPSASYDEQGNVVALAASAFGSYACGESPAERLAALRLIDAETRFDRLKKQYLSERGM